MLRLFIKARTIFPLLAAFLVLWIAAPARAQTDGQLRVVVVDDQDELPINGVTLQVSGDTLIGGVQERPTDANGEALFGDLPPGMYRLVAAKAGFRGTTIEGILVSINRTTQHQVKLKAGETEEVTVVAKQQAVDTESTSSGQVLTKEFLQRIPAGRTYQSAVQTVPGVTGAGGGNMNMAGSANNENTYLLDGANVTDPVTGTFSLNFNFDAIQQIEVLLGGYNPEYGVSVGGIINVVTESGTNNLQFLTRVDYTNGNLAPRPEERLAADGVPIAPTGFDSTFQLFTVSTVLSGPLIRDKAWFILSYQGSRSVIANVGIPQARDFDGHYLLAKLTYQPNPEHRLAWFLQTNPTTIDNTIQNDPFTKAEAQSRQAQGGFTTNLRWQWFLAPEMNLDTAIFFQKIFIEANAVPCTHDRTSDSHPCRAGEPEGFIDWETPGRTGLSGAYNSVNYGRYYFDDRLRYNGSSKLSMLSVDDPLGGTHDLKFGVEGSQIVWDQIQGFSGNQLYFDINQAAFDPQTFTNYIWLEITGPIKFRTTASQYSAFAQDSWKPVKNLTINYGSRFDSFVMRNDLGEPVLTGSLLGPRLFGAWDPWGDQKTKVATGYGRFNDTGTLTVASFTSARGIGTKQYLGEVFTDLGFGTPGEFGFVNTQGYLAFGTPKDNLSTANETLRAPRVDEVLLTLEREIIEDVAIFSTMTGKFTRHLYEFDDVNLIWDSDGSALIGTRLADPLNSYPRLRTPALAKRDYFRWDLGMRKIESRRWAAQASYSFSQSIGSSIANLSGSFANDPQTQFNYGPLNTDLRHTARAQAYWDLPTDPWTQTIGFSFLYTDGYPEERLYIAETPLPSYSLRVRPRGTYLRFNPTWFVNLQFIQTIDVRKGEIDLGLIVENIFNNRAPEVGSGAAVDTDNRLITIVRQDPLRLVFSAAYEF